MLFFLFKVIAGGLIIAFSSWLAGQNPKLAGFIIALPLVSLIAILFSYYEHNDTEKTVMLVNFVADAANDMMEKVARMVQTGKIRSSSAYAQFEPKKGWVSFTGKHHNSMNRIFELFISRYATSKQFYTKMSF